MSVGLDSAPAEVLNQPLCEKVAAPRELVAPAPIDALGREGVALGLGTNAGTLWLQELAKNHRVSVPRQPDLVTGVSVQASTSGNSGGPRGLNLVVSVEDARMRQHLPGFDNMEQVFALVPHPDASQVRWQEHALTWVTRLSIGRSGTRHFDIHELHLPAVDVDLLREHGVAVGVRTNAGTLWAQKPGPNHPVSET